MIRFLGFLKLKFDDLQHKVKVSIPLFYDLSYILLHPDNVSFIYFLQKENNLDFHHSKFYIFNTIWLLY